MVDSINATASAFFRQSAPATFACSLLANYLSNMVGEYRTFDQPSPRPRSAANEAGHTEDLVQAVETAGYTRRRQHRNLAGHALPLPEDRSGAPAVDEAAASVYNFERPSSTLENNFHTSSETMQPWSLNNAEISWTFADEDSWFTLFSDGGVAAD